MVVFGQKKGAADESAAQGREEFWFYLDRVAVPIEGGVSRGCEGGEHSLATPPLFSAIGQSDRTTRRNP